MTPLRLLLVALAAVLVFPGAAGAVSSGARTVALELAPGETGSLSGAGGRFDLAGARWRGPGSVEIRARRDDGGWTPWRSADPEPEDRPDAGGREGRLGRGWTLGNPWWFGPSSRLEVRTRGRTESLRVTLVRSPEVRIPLRRQQAAGAPAIVPRAGWGANEGIRKGDPTYAPELRYAVVHHTAGASDYSRSEAAAIVRGIQLFHVQSNGWNDIGYNFLVDRFGTVYEGRYGGVDQNVVGAHAQGFNTGSVGVALLGTFTGSRPTLAAERALASLLAWRLDLAHVDPLASLTVVSGGNERYPAGVPIQLRAISGHRDTGFTVCPGDALYGRLGELARQTAATGAPKLYDPEVSAEPGGIVRFRARLSEPLPWAVSITGGGREVARGTGSGSTIDWSWDSSAAGGGELRWAITAGSGTRAVRQATGSLGVRGEIPALEFTGAAADPETISPNGDGLADTSTVSYGISAPATVAVSVVDETETEVALLEQPRWRRAGEHAVVFDGAGLPDGRYAVRLLARSADGTEAEARVPVAVTRTLGTASIAPNVFSPNNDGRVERVTVSFALTRRASVTVRVFREGRWIATPYTGELLAGRRLVRWDGSKRTGTLRDGAYTAVLEVTDEVAAVRAALPFSSDTTAPLVRVVSRAPARITVSEPATLRLLVNGAVRRLRVDRAGEAAIPGVRTLRTLRLTARDRVGNVTTAVLLR